MSKPFVVPIDGSANAERALHYAIQLAEGIDVEIVLVNVQPDYNHAPNVKKFFSEQEVKQYQQQVGNEILAAAIEQLEERSLNFSTEIRIGVAGVEIANAAKERGATGIIMGSRGLGPIRGAVLGSVSYSVLHNSPCPVTIIP